jgi:hypothetical protein
MGRKKRGVAEVDNAKLQKLNSSATHGKNKLNISDFLDESSDDEEEELDPVRVARAVRECCKTYDRRGNPPDGTTFRKQVELECGFAENHLQAYQGVIVQMRIQQNEDLIRLSKDDLANIFTERRVSMTKEMEQTSALRDKELKKKGIGRAEGENFSEFHKYRKASFDLCSTAQYKNRKSRYSQVLGKSTSDAIQQRNRKMEEKDRKRREKKAKRGGLIAPGKNKKGSTNEGAWKKKEIKSRPCIHPKRRRFEGLFKYFYKQKAIEPMFVAEKEEEEDDEEEKAVHSDADLISNFSSRPPSEW